MLTALRMLGVAWRLARCDACAPWRSPLLRWRMETYGILDERGQLLHADAITPWQFFRFMIIQRRALCRFLRWAARL